MTADSGPVAAGSRPAVRIAWRMPAAAILLGAGCVAWALLPYPHKGLALFATLIAGFCAFASALRLTLGWIPLPDDSFWLPVPVRLWTEFLRALRVLPWEEIAAAALVWLEVQHSSRPWHTAVLGLALAAYLLAVHLAESRAPVASLRPLGPALGVGLVLLAAAAGFAMLPPVAPGPGAAWLRVVASLAVIVAAGLALPAATPRR